MATLSKDIWCKWTFELCKISNPGEAELNCLVRSSMYKGVLDNLFGENVLPTSDEVSTDHKNKRFACGAVDLLLLLT